MSRRSKKRRPAARRKSSVPVILLNIAIVICTLILVFTVVAVIRENKEYGTSYYNESSARYRIEDEEFGRLASDYVDNGRCVAEDLDEPEYVAQYTLAAYFYRANAEAGDKALADKYLSEMEEARSRLSAYQGAADRVDVLLEIDR